LLALIRTKLPAQVLYRFPTMEKLDAYRPLMRGLPGQEDFDSIELYEERAVHAGTRPEYSQNAANPSLAMLNAGQRQSVVSSGYSRNHGSTYIAPTENSLEGGGSLSDLWSFTKSTKLDQRTQVNRLCGAKAEVYGAFGLSAVFRGYGGHKQITLRMESEKHLRQNLP